LGLSIFSFSWLTILLVHPHDTVFRFVQGALCGSIDKSVFHYSFPFLPWLSFYLINTCIGEKIGIYQRNNELTKISKTFLVIGSAFFILAISLKFGSKAIQTYFLLPSNQITYWLTSPYQKLPPSPVYFAFYGSLTYFILFFLLKLRNWSFTKQVVKVTSILGRSSLFVFIVQYYIYFALLPFMNLSYSIFWPFFLIGSIVPIIAVAFLWDKKQFNRFITLRINSFWKKSFQRNGASWAQ
jgi:hypothetical protein